MPVQRQGKALRGFCGFCRKLSVKLPVPLSPLPRLSLGLRWTLAAVLLTVTGLGIFGGIAIQQHHDSLTRQMERMGQTMAAQFAATVAEPLLAEDRLSLNVMLQRMAGQDGVLRVSVYANNGPALHAPPLPDGPRVDTPSRGYRAPIRFDGIRVGHVVLTLDGEALNQGLLPGLWKVAASALLLMLLMALAAVVMSRRLVRPLKVLEHLWGGPNGLSIPAAAAGSGSEEIDRIVQLFNHMASGMQDKQHLERLLHRYVPVTLMDTLIPGTVHALPRARPAEGSVLFSDVSGFTALSESLPPDQVADLLNDYFTYLTAAVHACGGVVDSFIGDCVMVVFAGSEDDHLHPLRAATCALLIQATVRRLNVLRSRNGGRTLQFRSSVNSGPLAICELGGQDRMQPTVIGDTVNVAARLCGHCEPGEVLLGERTAHDRQVRARLLLTPLPRVELRGRQQTEAPSRAAALAPRHQTLLDDILDRILPLENHS